MFSWIVACYYWSNRSGGLVQFGFSHSYVIALAYLLLLLICGKLANNWLLSALRSFFGVISNIIHQGLCSLFLNPLDDADLVHAVSQSKNMSLEYKNGHAVIFKGLRYAWISLSTLSDMFTPIFLSNFLFKTNSA